MAHPGTAAAAVEFGYRLSADVVFAGTRPTVGIITLVLGVAVTSWGVVRRARAMVRGMADFTEPYGQTRKVADGQGAVTTGELASSTIEWTVFRE